MFPFDPRTIVENPNAGITPFRFTAHNVSLRCVPNSSYAATVLIEIVPVNHTNTPRFYLLLPTSPLTDINRMALLTQPPARPPHACTRPTSQPNANLNASFQNTF